MGKAEKGMALSKYRKKVQQVLNDFEEVFMAAAVGDFSKDLNIPEEEDEFTGLYVGVKLMIDVINEKIGKLKAVNRNLEKLVDEKSAALAKAQEIAHLGSWEWDVEKDKINWSDELYRIYGLAPGSREIRFEDFIGSVHPDDQERVGQIVGNAYQTHQPFDFYHRVLHPDGKVRTLHGRGEVVVREGKVVKMLGTAQDVTKQQKIETDLKRQTQSLKQSNKELEQFAYVAAHDLQEPLNNVISFATLLHTNYPDRLDERGKKSIQYIVKGVDRMKSLIQGLQEYSQIGHNRTFEPVDCNKLVALVQSDLATLMKETGGHLTVDQLPTINGMKVELRLLFQNLLHNAIKFRKKNIAPRIHVSAKEKAQRWEFAVADNGIGIDPKFKDRPFMIYQRLHVEDVYKGMGIGLAHCKKIVEVHKGEIWYSSQPGVGTTFYFTIPKSIG